MSHRVLTALAVANWMVMVAPAAAQELAADRPAPLVLLAPKLSPLVDATPTATAEPTPAASRKFSPLLLSLYTSHITLQALDVHSTLVGIRHGAVENNQLMSGIASNPPLFIAAKAGVSAATIFAVSRVAKRNRVAAVVTMAGINTAYALVVAHNYRIAYGAR